MKEKSVENFEKLPENIIELTLDEDVLEKFAQLRKCVSHKEDIEKLREEAKIFAEGGKRKAYIYTENGEALGYVELKSFQEAKLPNGEILHVDVSDCAKLSRIGRIVGEKSDGKGIGAQLLAQAETWAKQQGRVGLWLDYLEENTKAHDFYMKHGFEDIKSYPDLKKNKVRIIARKLF